MMVLLRSPQVHIPVLSKEVIRSIDPHPGDIVIDATADGGGHVMQLAKKVGPNGHVYALEVDTELVALLNKRISKTPLTENITVIQSNFSQMSSVAIEEKISAVQAVLFDLGLSSWHLEKSSRGFSFQKDEQLDMRFSKDLKKNAYDIVNHYSRNELRMVLLKYGQERYASRIAKSIEQHRNYAPISTTAQLVEVIQKAIPFSGRHIHPATKTFQALRIEVNNELHNIVEGIKQAFDILSPGGKIVVISYHSLEDRIVKQIFRDYVEKGVAEGMKRVMPKEAEIKRNKRARSAILRVIQKI